MTGECEVKFIDHVEFRQRADHLPAALAVEAADLIGFRQLLEKLWEWLLVERDIRMERSREFASDQ